MCKEESKFAEGFLRLSKELKFCVYTDVVVNPDDVSEDEAMILNYTSKNSEIIKLEDHVDHVEEERDHVGEPMEDDV